MKKTGVTELIYPTKEANICGFQANKLGVAVGPCSSASPNLLEAFLDLASGQGNRLKTAQSTGMNTNFPNNNNNVNANLQLLLELQRQQQEQQQQQQQLQQQLQLLQQQQHLQTSQQSSQQQSSLHGLQALLMDQRRQQQQLLSPSLLASLSGLAAQQQQPSSELESLLRQRESLVASQLLSRHQSVEEILSSSTPSSAPGARGANPHHPSPTSSAPLSALLGGNQNDSLRLLMEAASGQASLPDASAVQPNKTDSMAASSSQGERRTQEKTNEKEASSDEEDKVATSEGKTAEESDSEVDDTAEGEDEEDHPANDTFPFKLHRMLEHAEKSGLDDIISFTPDGKTFAIHKPREFVASIMPKYFTTSRMSSFQRQLNLYGFRRITEGRDKGAYYHKYFIKGRRALCKKVKRKKTSSKPPPTLDAQLQNSMSVRQLLAERQFGPQYGGLSGIVGPSFAAAASMGVNQPIPSHLDANQALANAQLSQRLEILIRQRQEEERLQRERQQQGNDQNTSRFPANGNSGSGNKFGDRGSGGGSFYI